MNRLAASAISTSLVALIGLGEGAAQQLPEDLPRYVDEVRQTFGVVGMAVAVVRDGEVLFSAGFGERELRTGEPVDESTLFAIGSNTKAFTAAGLGLLVDEGKLSWDDRVVDHLSWFQLHDLYATREMTLRDLLSHRSGLGRRGDSNWYATDFGRKEIVERIRHLEPETSFRARAGYQNTMFLTAGLVIEAVTGMGWDAWIQRRLLDPLGMTDSLTTVRGIELLSNVATPHAEIDGNIVAVPHRNIDNVAPAGSILSSVEEMSGWMRMMLARGVHQGERLISESVVDALWEPSVVYPLPPTYRALFPSTHFSTYGLGWGLRDYHGRKVATHTGGIDGMLSQVFLLPDEQIGVVVLTNTSPSGSHAHNAVTFHIVDALLGVPPSDWARAFSGLAEEQRESTRKASEERAAARLGDTTPSLPLERYAGEYRHAMYGTIWIESTPHGLTFRRHSDWVAELSHWHFDTFLARFHDPVMGESLLTFEIGASGDVVGVAAEGLSSFARVPGADP